MDLRPARPPIDARLRPSRPAVRVGRWGSAESEPQAQWGERVGGRQLDWRAWAPLGGRAQGSDPPQEHGEGRGAWTGVVWPRRPNGGDVGVRCACTGSAKRTFSL